MQDISGKGVQLFVLTMTIQTCDTPLSQKMKILAPVLECITHNGVARMLKKLGTSKGDDCIKQGFSTITPLFKMGNCLKGKNLLLEGANSLL